MSRSRSTTSLYAMANERGPLAIDPFGASRPRTFRRPEGQALPRGLRVGPKLDSAAHGRSGRPEAKASTATGLSRGLAAMRPGLGLQPAGAVGADRRAT